MFVLAEFLFDFPFNLISVCSGRWEPFEMHSSTSWLSLCINLRKQQIDRSKGQRAYLFVNGRKEDVKFSRINCFASLFGIIRNLQY